jgi:uncharacterized protein (TIGR03382 family)
VTVTASDTRGNVRSCTFDVTVKLGVPLAVSCPAELDVTAPDGTGAVVDPLPLATTATDNGQPPTVTYSPASGTKFPLGRTQVTVTAMDDRMNVQTCTFDVVVTPGNQSPYAWSCACSNAGAAPLVALLAALAQRRRRRR